MKSLIYRHTKYQNNKEITIIYILGVSVFKRVIIDNDDRPRRACGFNVFPSDAPGHFDSEFDDEDDDDTDE